MKILSVQSPNGPEEDHPLNEETLNKFGLDEADLLAENERLRGEVKRESWLADQQALGVDLFAKDLDAATARAEAAERERDEARQLLHDLATILNPHEAYDATKIAGWARDTVDRARERDEARAQFAAASAEKSA